MAPLFRLHAPLRSAEVRGDVYPNHRAPQANLTLRLLRASFQRSLRRSSGRSGGCSVERLVTEVLLVFLLSLLALPQNCKAQAVDGGQAAPSNLKQLSLEEL